jgi:hypothetical protein
MGDDFMTNTTAGKEERGTDAYTVENPAGLAEAREVMRPLYASREFWLLVAHAEAFRLPLAIALKYYRNAGTADFVTVPAMVNGEAFVAIAMRKRRMMNWQYNSLLRQVSKIRLTDREVASRDLLVVARPEHLDNGTNLAAALFDDPNGERGDAGGILTVDGRLPMAA